MYLKCTYMEVKDDFFPVGENLCKLWTVYDEC